MNTTSGASETQRLEVYLVEVKPLNGILAQNWWAMALRGLLGILFGLIAFFLPGAMMLSIILIFAGYLLADGVLGVTGIIAAVWPGLTLFLVLIVAAWAIVTGGVTFAAALNLDTEHGHWWLALGGIISVAFGVLLIVAPLLGALVLTWWLGAYALAFGIVLVILAVSPQRPFKRRGRSRDLRIELKADHYRFPRSAIFGG